MSLLSNPRIALTTQDRVTIDAIHYRVVEAFGQVILARANAPSLMCNFSHQEFFELSTEERCSIDRNYYAVGNMHARLRASTANVLDLPSEQQEQMLHRQTWCDLFLQLERETKSLAPAKRMTRSEKKLTLAIKQIETRLNEMRRTDRKRADSKTANAFCPPSYKTLLIWVKLYEAAGFNILGLRDTRYRSGNRGPRFPQPVYALMVRFRQEYLTPREPHVTEVYRDLEDAIKDLNRKRLENGQHPFPIPCSETFRLFIVALDDFHIDLGRKGLEYARAKHYISGEGQEISMVGQIVEMDEWLVHLHLLLTELGVYDLFSDEEKALIERTRWHLSVAMDAESRVFLAMHLSPTATPLAAMKTLAAVFKDKSAYSDAAGCRSTWSQRTGVGVLRNDNGSAYIKETYRLAAAAVGAGPDLTPTGRPQLRARVERAFSTLAKGFTSLFEGRTFTNAFAGRHYESQARASLTPEQLGRAIVRYVVDVYHNTPHSGLGGETPSEAWDRLTRLNGIVPLPSRAVQREAFGRRRVRRITTYGVEFAGLHYQNDALIALRLKHGDDAEAEIAVDLDDLGFISVLTPQGWSTAKCIDDSVSGVSFDDYIRIARNVELARRQNRPEIEAIVSDARKALRQLAKDSAAKANISRQEVTERDLDRALADVTDGLGRPRGHASEQMIAGGSFGKRIKVDESREQQPPKMADAGPRMTFTFEDDC